MSDLVIAPSCSADTNGLLPIYQRANDWTRFFQDLDSGKVLTVDHAMYQYFLDIIPPRSIGSWYFTTQEGDGDMIRFEDIGGIYQAGLLNKLIVNHENGNTIMVKLSRSSFDKAFTVRSAYLCDFNIPQDIEVHKNGLNGQEPTYINTLIKTVKRSITELK